MYSNTSFEACLICEKLHLLTFHNSEYIFIKKNYFTRMILLLIIFLTDGFCETVESAIDHVPWPMENLDEIDPPYECPQVNQNHAMNQWLKINISGYQI